ncbi:MAG: cytochrome c biogenesis protein ResB [Mariprofundales bacterium]|nr:cytochrome c biogenesis protein ResB [Mariprofundales bacterium]
MTQKNLPSLIKILLARLGTMPLAILLLIVLALASSIGTVLLQNQGQTDYLQQFGPLWYWVLRALGMFDMYHSWWFIALLGFLMASVGACLWRNVPRMLGEMRARKITLPDRIWKRMENQQQWEVKGTSVDQVVAQVRTLLPGWDWLQDERDGATWLRGDRGRYHKWGYILVHSAILVILIGGWLSVHYGFRGNMSVPEKGQEKEISFVQGSGVGHLTMPFSVRCNKFHIEFFPNGMPKEFRSNLTIIDHGKEVMTKDIIVNGPLYYKGVRIFQASFGDGGSDINLKLYHLDGSGTTSMAHTAVYDTWKDPTTGVSLEITDFKPYNVENMGDPGKAKKFQDLGPAVEFVLRGKGLKSVKIKSFMNPFVLGDDDRGSFMMVSLTGDAKDYQAVPLGLDFSNPKEWKLFNAFVGRLAQRTSKKSGESGREANINAFKQAVVDVFGDKRPANLPQMGTRVVQSVKTLMQMPWPFLPVLENYDQVYYTGLQLTQDPGINVVWVGSGLLVFGLCIMFYMSHRKIWLRVIKTGETGVNLHLAGRSNRNPLAFTEEFHQLFNKLQQGCGIDTKSTKESL